MRDIPEGQVTMTLADYHLLIDSAPEKSPDYPVGGITELHNKWAAIFEKKHLKTREYIKIEKKEAQELLTDILSLLK